MEKFNFMRWFSKHRNQIVLAILGIVIAVIISENARLAKDTPDTISYSEFVAMLEEGRGEAEIPADAVKEDGVRKDAISGFTGFGTRADALGKNNPASDFCYSFTPEAVQNDIVDTVYVDGDSDYWRITLWTDESRKAYQQWLADGKNPASFTYDYPIENWRRVQMGDWDRRWQNEFQDKYLQNQCCRSFVKKSFEPFYASAKKEIGTLLLMLGFMYVFFSIYAKKLDSMGGANHSLFVGDTGIKFSDVIGIDEVVDDLRLITNLMKAQKKPKKKPQNPKDGKKKPADAAEIPKGILLYGDAGVGKTTIAKAIAGEAGVPFFCMNASEFVNQFVGRGAKNVRDLFEKAVRFAPSVVFIDELDAIGIRNPTMHQEVRQTLNALLNCMDGFDSHRGVIVIAATNCPNDLDPALVRSGRFDRLIHIMPPQNTSERVRFFDKFLHDIECTADIRKIASQCVGFTGADIEAICNEACLIAKAEDAETITTEILEAAFDKKALNGNRKKNEKKDLHMTAIHEAGHAVMDVFFGEKIARATIAGTTSGVGGFVAREEQEERASHMTKKEMENTICILYGGRVAEKIFFGEENITDGAGNDLERASKHLKNYVTKIGFSEEFGTLCLSDFPSAEETAFRIADKVSKRLYALTETVLTANKDAIEALAQALEERETMSGDEVMEVIKPLMKMDIPMQ